MGASRCAVGTQANLHSRGLVARRAVTGVAWKRRSQTSALLHLDVFRGHCSRRLGRARWIVCRHKRKGRQQGEMLSCERHTDHYSVYLTPASIPHAPRIAGQSCPLVFSIPSSYVNGCLLPVLRTPFARCPVRGRPGGNPSVNMLIIRLERRFASPDIAPLFPENLRYFSRAQAARRR